MASNERVINELSNVDQVIYDCLNHENPKSFFLFAGAGSGKTRSLVTVLQKLKDEEGHHYRTYGQQIAIITYTNAASDEIKRRLAYDPIFAISTIHSFSWELIRFYQEDIRMWVNRNLEAKIVELIEKIRKRNSESNAKKLEKYSIRMDSLATVKRFSYDPNGSNSGRDSLNHDEVIKMAAEFLQDRPLMQSILVSRFPILLVDESQDTKKELISSFFQLEESNRGKFSLGLFGDTMQRIYMDGKPDLGQNLPDSWEKPFKKVNYRCPKRVISLINSIRGEQPQEPGPNNPEGVVRLFVVGPSECLDKDAIELAARQQMATITGDDFWNEPEKVKTLTIEHAMAARRDGFLPFFEALKDIDNTGLLDGKMSGIPFLEKQVMPLVTAILESANYKVAQHLIKHSPSLNARTQTLGENVLADIRGQVKILKEFLVENESPTLLEILKVVRDNGLLEVPDVLLQAMKLSEENQKEEERIESNRIYAWHEALQSTFASFEKYTQYINDNSRFGTHQGVKGLEFERVMVILDDEEAKGNLFSYEKIFGAKALSENDLKNQREGKETSLDRTKRLFYVTCSRAEQSLAIVAYTQNKDKLVKTVADMEWFSTEEVVCV